MVGPQQTTGLIGQKWKTGNGWELTGTNRPTQTTPPTPTRPPQGRQEGSKGNRGKRAAKCEASTIRSTPNPPPNHTHTQVGSGKGKWATTPHNRINNTRRHSTANSRLGGHSDRETPGPIPNPEAKPDSADGTAPARVRESRTPPSTHHTAGPGTANNSGPGPTALHTHTQNHHPQTTEAGLDPGPI